MEADKAYATLYEFVNNAPCLQREREELMLALATLRPHPNGPSSQGAPPDDPNFPARHS